VGLAVGCVFVFMFVIVFVFVFVFVFVCMFVRAVLSTPKVLHRLHNVLHS
jgi:hypothetical protein